MYRRPTQTRTYALMEVSESTFQEIRRLLVEAGYEHAILHEGDEEHLNMSGVAVCRQTPARCRLVDGVGNRCGRERSDEIHGSGPYTHTFCPEG